MTLLTDIAGHDLWLQFTCGRVVKRAVEGLTATSTEQIERVAVCSECGAKVAPQIGLRIVRSLDCHRDL